MSNTCPTLMALPVFLFPLAYSPGPGNLFFAAQGARFGLRATLSPMVGYHVATFLATLAVGFGLDGLSAASPGLFWAIRTAGAGYVFWLAIKLMRAGRIGDMSDARPAGFADGVVLLVLNPKAFVIIVLMLTQFPGDGSAAHLLAVSAIFTLNNLLAFAVWSAAGDMLVRRFRSESGAHRLNLFLGMVLAAVALWMLQA